MPFTGSRAIVALPERIELAIGQIEPETHSTARNGGEIIPTLPANELAGGVKTDWDAVVARKPLNHSARAVKNLRTQFSSLCIDINKQMLSREVDQMCGQMSGCGIRVHRGEPITT